MQITWPSDTTEIIEDIINTIGKPVEFIQVTTSGCPICSLDPVTNTSTNSFCPVCSGLYWIPIETSTTISAHVTWKASDVLNWQTGGMLFDGDAAVKIMYTDTNATIIENTAYLVVEGKEMEIKKSTLLGVPQTNRILLDTVERKKEHA